MIHLNLRYTAASPAKTPNASRNTVEYVCIAPSVEPPLATIRATPAVIAVQTGAAMLTISRLALLDVFPTIENEPRNMDNANRVSRVVRSLAPISTSELRLSTMSFCAVKAISLACSAISCKRRTTSSLG